MLSVMAMHKKFILALKKQSSERNTQDLDVIYSYLHSLEGLSPLREPVLRSICKSVRYEFHRDNTVLYCRGEIASCWYILLSGSVFIDGSMFLPRTSFGKRTGGSARRNNECLILEPSETIVVDYPEVQMMKPGAGIAGRSQPPSYSQLHHNAGKTSTASSGREQAPPQPDHAPRHNRYVVTQNDISHVQPALHNQPIPPELQGVQDILHRRENLLRSSNGSDMSAKRNSHASDTSSAYSGSDVLQSSLEDQDIDFTGLVESLVDSDDEEGYIDNNETLLVRDTVRECLEKDAAERTEDDIETLLEFMQHLPAFANMTLATRRSLCAVMVFAVVDRAGTTVMDHGEELDSWSVILNGTVEIVRPDRSAPQTLAMGDSFGITPTTEKMYHNGVMKTKEDNCQFVCIEKSDYYRILHQGEENTRRHEENGKLVLVTERRVLDGGNRQGHIVIKGTPERLIQHLVEEQSSVDPTYVEDFLLTYRTFLKSPSHVADQLLTWFNDPKTRDRVTRVVLLWVNNHFNDFEAESQMTEFLEKFEIDLEREKMGGQLRLLDIACAAKAQTRTVTLTRATREEILHFSVLGGLERGCGIFISKVEKASKPHEAGLKRGDQCRDRRWSSEFDVCRRQILMTKVDPHSILEVNNHNFEHISHNRALEILRGTTHLAITVKSNLLAFKEMLLTSDGSTHLNTDTNLALGNDYKQRLSVPDLNRAVQPVINSPHKDKRDRDRGFMSTGHKTKIRKALMKFNFLPRNVHSDTQLNNLDDLGSYTKGHGRKGSSSSSTNSSPIHTPRLTHSTSNPDLSSIGQYESSSLGLDYPEHVLRVYRIDQTCKYLLVHRETSAREVVMLALKEFGISDPSNNYSLCEVTVEYEGLVKQKRLPDPMTNLPDRINLNGRYYLKNNHVTDTLVPDELVSELIKDCQVSILQLNCAELAAQVTLRDFQLFHDIEPTEYIDDLLNLKSSFGTPHLNVFSELVNKEMFWVITEIISEPNVVRRSKILKHFIKTARHCKECKNFNSMFAVISGLGHSSVSRLRNTWDRVPSKYNKMFEDLQDLMDPSRNMSKYRNLVNSEMVQAPLVPFFPVVKKDLTFIHLGNDSKVEGLINFEKLRMIAKEVRHVCNMASAQYDMDSMYYSYGSSSTLFSSFGSHSVPSVATMRRKRRNSTVPNPKKMYEEALMVRRVRAYLQSLKIIEDESRFSEMSQQCEPSSGGTRKRDPSPSPALLQDDRLNANLGPKFGAEEPEAVRKMMGLADKVRPHHPHKGNHLPPSHLMQPKSPVAGRRPASPKQRRGHLTSNTAGPPHVMHLSPESSSLGNLNPRKLTSSVSVCSNDSNSPTSSITNYIQPQYETDSGHNSIASSCYDSHSASSAGSASSPPAEKRYHLPSGLTIHPPQHHPTDTGGHYQNPSFPSQARPPLPGYQEVVQKNKAYNQFIKQQYVQVEASGGAGSSSVGGRPPLPDYDQAIRINQQRQQMAQHGRSLSCDGVLSGTFYNNTPAQDYVDGGLADDDEPQVSAV